MNNVIGLTDKEGNLTEEYLYTPYGKTINYKPSTINQFLFSGRRYDPESGLYYFRYRYYDPGLGRFLTQEPLLSGDLFVNLVNNLNYAKLNYLSLGGLKDIFNQRLQDVLRIANLYQYPGNNPISQTDPLGLHKNEPRPNPCGGTGTGAGGGGGGGGRKPGDGYVDINISLGFGPGLTTGVMISSSGQAYPYVGFGIVSSPAISVTVSPTAPSPGWNVGMQISIGYITTQFGYSPTGGFAEFGTVFGWSPSFTSFALTAYYVFGPIPSGDSEGALPGGC